MARDRRQNSSSLPDPGFPDPPFPLACDRYTPETHEADYRGGSLGRWQTRSNVPGPTSVNEQRYLTLMLDWHVTDRWTLESLTSRAETVNTRQVTDWDASEFTQALTMERGHAVGMTQELHLTGNLDGAQVEPAVDVPLDAWGYGPATIGRPGELGVAVRFTFD